MIALIPARGGSKGLPNKNILEFNGKPLIAHAIEGALNSKSVERVIVTTDSEEIAEVARKAGAEVPFLRPEELATDNAKAVDVYLHAIEYLMQNEGAKIDKFMVLLPTTPLRKSSHIDEAVELFEKEKADTLVSMKVAETPVSWYFEKNDEGTVKNAGFGAQTVVDNRQVNKEYYVPNGAIYILDYEVLKNNRTYYTDNTIAYIMNHEESVDIDTKLEFEFAEFLSRR